MPIDREKVKERVVAEVDAHRQELIELSRRIHAHLAPPDVGIHSREFAECAGGPKGGQALIEAAKAMAMTAVDVMASPDLRCRMEEEFRSDSSRLSKALR